MIKIVAKNYIKSDKVEDFISLAKKLVEETNKNDKGCISYELFQDLTDPKIVTIIEEWEDKDSLNLHMAAKHFKVAVSTFKEYIEKPGETNLYRRL